MATPMAIAINIHSVKYLSKKLNFFLSGAGAQLFADILLYFYAGLKGNDQEQSCLAL